MLLLGELADQFDGLFLDAYFVTCGHLFDLGVADRLRALVDGLVSRLEDPLLFRLVNRIELDPVGVEASLTRFLLL